MANFSPAEQPLKMDTWETGVPIKRSHLIGARGGRDWVDVGDVTAGLHTALVKQFSLLLISVDHRSSPINIPFGGKR